MVKLYRINHSVIYRVINYKKPLGGGLPELFKFDIYRQPVPIKPEEFKDYHLHLVNLVHTKRGNNYIAICEFQGQGIYGIITQQGESWFPKIKIIPRPSEKITQEERDYAAKIQSNYESFLEKSITEISENLTRYPAKERDAKLEKSIQAVAKEMRTGQFMPHSWPKAAQMDNHR